MFKWPILSIFAYKMAEITCVRTTGSMSKTHDTYVLSLFSARTALALISPSVAAEGILGWGCKHFPRAPDILGLQERGPYPLFIMQFFIDIGVFFKVYFPVRAHHSLYS